MLPGVEKSSMEFTTSHISVAFLLVLLFLSANVRGQDVVSCPPGSRCTRTKTCPHQCPQISPTTGKKACYIDCNKPSCETQCKDLKPNCYGYGAACKDPRFIGGDGTVFYFRGERNQHYSLVSDHNLQINSRFIGHRPAGRTRDFTWIQALGILFDSHSFTVEATKAVSWDDEVDHLRFSFDGMELEIPQGYPSVWNHSANAIRVERTSRKNSVVIILPRLAMISLNVVPVTKEDDRIHSYHVPSDDCFAHLDVQFNFFALSPKVEGVLGRTYQPDFVSPAKPGVAMPIVGGEDKYRTTSLLSTDCNFCVFSSSARVSTEENAVNHGNLDCTGSSSRGYALVCRK